MGAERPLTDDRVEDFVLESTAGETIGLAESIGGKRCAIVVFWSGVCSHCQRYDDYLDAFGDDQPEIALLVVACREGESAADLRRVAAERRLSFPILIDADRSLAQRWRVHQTPKVFLVSPRLEVLYRGAIDNFTYPDDDDHAAYLEAAITDHLAGRAVRRPETQSFGCAVESVYYKMSRS